MNTTKIIMAMIPATIERKMTSLFPFA